MNEALERAKAEALDLEKAYYQNGERLTYPLDGTQEQVWNCLREYVAPSHWQLSGVGPGLHFSPKYPSSDGRMPDPELLDTASQAEWRLYERPGGKSGLSVTSCSRKDLLLLALILNQLRENGFVSPEGMTHNPQGVALTQVSGRCQEPKEFIAAVQALIRRNLPADDSLPLHSGQIDTTGVELGELHRRHIISAVWRGLERRNIGYVEVFKAVEVGYQFELARYADTPSTVEDDQPAQDFFDGLAYSLQPDLEPRPIRVTPDTSLPLHSGDAEAIDTRKVVEMKLGLPYETAIAIAHQIINTKCGSGTWHGSNVESIAGGVGMAFHLWWEGTSDGQHYRQDTGSISIYTNGTFISKPYGVRDADNTTIRPSPSVEDVLPDNDYPQIAREVLNALIVAQGETASGAAEPPQSTERKAGRRGRRSQWDMSARDEIVKKWENRTHNESRTLEVFLVDELGEKDHSDFEPKPLLSKTQFYQWRRDYYERHPQKHPIPH